MTFSQDPTVKYCVHRDAPHFDGSRASSPSLSRTTSLDSVNRPMSNPLQLQPANYAATVNGLYGYERTSQSPVNNFCRFPPSLVDESYDESYDFTQDNQVSAHTLYIIKYLHTRYIYIYRSYNDDTRSNTSIFSQVAKHIRPDEPWYTG